MPFYPSYIRTALTHRAAINCVDESENLQNPNKTPAPGTKGDAQHTTLTENFAYPGGEEPVYQTHSEDGGVPDVNTLHREGGGVVHNPYKRAQVSIQEINQPDNLDGMPGGGQGGMAGQLSEAHHDENREEDTIHMTGIEEEPKAHDAATFYSHRSYPLDPASFEPPPIPIPTEEDWQRLRNESPDGGPATVNLKAPIHNIGVEGTTSDASVKAPYSSGMGEDSTMTDIDQSEHNLIKGAGLDPYKMGHIYTYYELSPQHRKEVKINKKALGKHYRDLMWLRTAMSTAQLVEESTPWYNNNRSNKWGLKDNAKVYKLADMFMNDATVTPLLVSPPGERNGGLWEGYHRLRAHDMLGMEVVPVIMKVDPYDPASLDKTAQFHHEPWVCVDFDDTLAQKDPDGEHLLDSVDPVEGAQAALKQMIGKGWRVTIFTARAHFADKDPEWKPKVEKWLHKHDIPYSEIWSGPKPPADAFIDNAAIHFDGDWGEALQGAEAMIGINKSAVGSGVLDTGDNESDSYTNGDETRSGAAFPLDETFADLNQKTAYVMTPDFYKRTAAIKFQPAFRDTGLPEKVWVCSTPFHNIDDVSAEDLDSLRGELESGFTDVNGKFYTRAEALATLNAAAPARPTMNVSTLISEDLMPDENVTVADPTKPRSIKMEPGEYEWHQDRVRAARLIANRMF